MKPIFTVLLLFFIISGFTHKNSDTFTQEKPKIGDVLVIAKNTSNNYKYIKFPKKNILHKRGALANYDKVYGAEVIITEVKENKYGRIEVKLVRTDGKKFFNKIKSVSAVYFKAIDSGELLKKK